MEVGTRKILDKAFTSTGIVSIALLAATLFVFLAPIAWRGSKAFVFRQTIERRKLMFERLDRGDPEDVEAALAAAVAARKPVYDAIARFEAELKDSFGLRRKYAEPLDEFKEHLRKLLGPLPGEPTPVLPRDQYGETRWDGALLAAHDVLTVETYDYSDPTKLGIKVKTPRADEFKGTRLEPLFPYIENNLHAMVRPTWTFYWRFLFDSSFDAHFFGGIWPEMLGTLYLTMGAMIFAVPVGVISAIYLVEYSGEGRIVSLLRTFVSTLAGVPSIVFGMFGLAFFINTMHVSEGKSVLAGALTLALVILPTIIRASEEAIRAVPQTYKEAALSVGASQWRSIVTVVLPAALPGILTGIVISMGRAAGETAPIIFTAAVSVGKPLALWQTLTDGTPALSWNIYNLATEHEAIDEILHVQYGMVLTLVGLVLLLNVVAIVLRARISRKLKGATG